MHRCVALILIAASVFIPLVGHADNTGNVVFTVSAKRCVTLRQGQPCFARVLFEWQSSEAREACVFGMQGKKISCWKSARNGKLVMSQTLSGTTEYLLLDPEGKGLARTQISVSWVYKKKRSNRRSRLF